MPSTVFIFLFQVEGCKNRPPFLEDFHVLVVVVNRPVFPAPKEDSNPFEGQRSNDGVIFFAFASVVIDVVASPLAAGHGESSEFMETLPLKLGPGPPEINHSGFAAAFGHRTYAAEGLNVLSLRVPRAIGSKECREPRCHHRAGAGELAERRELRMIVEDFFDSLIV